MSRTAPAQARALPAPRLLHPLQAPELKHPCSSSLSLPFPCPTHGLGAGRGERRLLAPGTLCAPAPWGGCSPAHGTSTMPEVLPARHQDQGHGKCPQALLCSQQQGCRPQFSSPTWPGHGGLLEAEPHPSPCSAPSSEGGSGLILRCLSGGLRSIIAVCGGTSCTPGPGTATAPTPSVPTAGTPRQLPGTAPGTETPSGQGGTEGDGT